MNQSEWMTQHSAVDAFTFLKTALVMIGVFCLGYMMLSAEAPSGQVPQSGFNVGMAALGIVYVAVVVGVSLKRRA